MQYLNITNRQPHWDPLQSQNNFVSRIQQEIRTIEDFDWRKIDLVTNLFLYKDITVSHA